MVEARKQMRGEALRSLLPMVKYSGSNVDQAYRHLVSLRASVINDCKACITTHRRDARSDGWDETRILRAEDWTNHRDRFDEKETAVLALTDAVTHVDGYESVPDELWDSVEELFGTQGAHDVLVSILAINTFNRLSITTRTNADAITSTIPFDHDYDATL
ncbi:carboxymuconolactone decarboxylase family protein [Corynebacterium sanguinis]|uniref:carboxymuconolactone decarboxylase family protein n=1 Tax=Corynebacterium sanguinis TaxID=2594913 RepID=UPI0011A3FC1C|nr:carboxymuconolactone decarboxylase family protein [Corynebacterium sanguinis]MCT1413444.1 carboxymuconolactone decarboxylase family protein [Corynebacterium sanguinis]MCT1613246.1 carboxymuconolactone decarboxylase family protein [Corynebacterium sanguinis]MCT1664345.1 carboxymuconolactone decarboxylase family protein [Corynebacterium sanguinis]MCT1805353.1 carboxymuconolactone decarboxylase family protein [Corynebacterium sanguinis]MCT2158520.1 carboxymuconolactone decarboxylase family pro